MASVAMNTAATGLRALSTNLDVIANNLANINTTGFKRARVNFEDLLYQHKLQPGSQNGNGDTTPAGIHVGLGVRVATVSNEFEQGSFEETGGKFDLAIGGNGLFQVSAPQFEEGVAYTRAGNFFVNQEGNLVLGTPQGLLLDPNIQLPTDWTDVVIGADGQVSVKTAASDAFDVAGQIEIATFTNVQGLKNVGGNLYVATAASGDPVVGAPNAEGRGYVLQGFLEASNVDPVKELIGMIQTQRYFEMNSQSIDAANQTLRVISSLGR
jgi:flagellar basal-body rod protein FlgG